MKSAARLFIHKKGLRAEENSNHIREVAAKKTRRRRRQFYADEIETKKPTESEKSEKKEVFSAAPRLWRSWLSKYLSFLYPLLFMLNQLRDDDDEPRDCFREIYKFLNESFMWAFRRRQLWLKITSSQEWASILCKFSVQIGSISILYWDDFTIDFFIGQRMSSLVICREDRLPPVEDPSSSQGKKTQRPESSIIII